MYGLSSRARVLLPSLKLSAQASGITGPLLGLLLLCLVLSLATDAFLTLGNLLNILDQVTVLGIMALGMTLVILIGGIDLSVGAVLAVSIMVMSWAEREAQSQENNA